MPVTEMPSVQVKGHKLFYETFGQGQPVLLMHGWMQVGRDLLALADSLSDTYRLVVPDLPGYGRSVPPYRTFPADFYDRDASLMIGFVEALGLAPVHLMGFSDGGEVALLMAAQHSDLCRSATAWGAVGYFDPELCDYARVALLPMHITDALRARHPGQNVDQWPSHWVDAFCTIIDAGGDVSLSRAGQIRCPVLLILGDQDKLNPIAAGRRFIEAASEADGIARQFEVFAGVGHYVHDERPDQFLPIVRSFLQANA